MNRNVKHPGRTYRRKPNSGDRTRNSVGYRVTASWPARPDRPAIRQTTDKAKARSIAEAYAEQGAYVILEKHAGYGEWRTLAELDGPALDTAERRAAREQREQMLAAQALADREARLDAEYAAQCARNDAARAAAEDRALVDVARLMVRPPVMRGATGRAAARHTAGSR